MDLTTVLSKIVSQDQKDLDAAQRFLQHAQENNFNEFLKALSDVLSNVNNEPNTRTAAGLQLKNCLTAKDAEIKRQYQQRWLALPDDVKQYVKKNVFNALGTETTRPSSAAQCVAYIAVTELPKNQWPDLITLMTQNVVNPQSTEMMKEATLGAIGYICQEIDPEVLVSQSNEILTAIVHGMRKEESSIHVRFAATTALLNSLEFTKANFDNDNERHFIMQVVCEATQSTNIPVKVAALQCLVKIMSLYYQYMEHYMGPALFAITIVAMKSEIDEVCLQGIEFWSNVCDEEVDLAIELTEATEQGKPPSRTSRYYAKGALQYLVPILTLTLTKQSEHDDEEDWNPCKAACVCLRLMASCCEDDIVGHVIPFVNDNIKHPDWRFRDAAVMAFGSILEGPDPQKLRPMVVQALPMFTELMNDSCVAVRDSVAWTIGRICEQIPDAVFSSNLDSLVRKLIENLSSEPRVAVNVGWAFKSLAEAAYETADQQENNVPQTFCLSPYFDAIVTRLFETADRQDANQANLRASAYEAIMELIKSSPGDCYMIVQKTSANVLQRLQHIVRVESELQQGSGERQQLDDYKSQLLATTQVILRRLTPEDVAQFSDPIMQIILQMLTMAQSRNSGVQEDAFMTVGALVEVMGEGFLKYMTHFCPFLSFGLRNVAELTVCQAAVGLLGDICRAICVRILPYCDEFMQILLANLGNANLNRDVKPQIISVFGDIALAIGTNFRTYLDVTLQALAMASQIEVDRSDFDLLEFLCDLRENTLEAYTLIVQGLKGDGEQPNPEVYLLQSQVPFMMQFVNIVAVDPDLNDALISACTGLVGDLCTAFGPSMLQYIDTEVINGLLNKARHSKHTKTRLLANWALRETKRLRGIAQQQQQQQQPSQ